MGRFGRSVLLSMAAIAVLASACTTTSTVRLASDRSIITTRGNAFTSSEMVQRDLLVQAATQAQAGGFEWFMVEDSRDVSTSGVFVTPASGSAEASGNPYAWRGSASYTGATYMPYVKPGAQVMVRFGNGPRPAAAFDAAEIIALNAAKK